MKKKIIYSLIAITLVGALVLAYMQMSGNTMEKVKARQSLELFLDENYPDLDYKIKRSAEYGWTDATYKFKVEVDNPVETTYSFYVSGIEPYEVFSDTIHESNIDKEASKKLNTEAEAFILPLLKKVVPEVDSISTDVSIYNALDEKWTPQLKTPKPFSIMLEIEKADLTKEQRLQQAKDIQKQLNNAAIDYHITEVGYSSTVNNEKEVEYISFTPEQQLTIKDAN